MLFLFTESLFFTPLQRKDETSLYQVREKFPSLATTHYGGKARGDLFWKYNSELGKSHPFFCDKKVKEANFLHEEGVIKS